MPSGIAMLKGTPRGPFFMSLAFAAMAIDLPAWLPIGAPPLVSLYTEATALLGWGLWLAWLASRPGGGSSGSSGWRSLARQPGLAAAVALFGVLVASVAASTALRGLPAAIGVRHATVLLAALLALLAGANLARRQHDVAAADLARAAMWALLLAGLANAALAPLQYLGIEGPWEQLGKDGRAGGNLAQPNLLATQLLWAYAALVALVDQGRIRRLPAWIMSASMLSALAFSASRSGALACLILALWGLLDRRLSRSARALLLAAPPLLLLAWVTLQAWQQWGGPEFAGTALLHKADPTSSRWRVWQQCAVLIAENPWAGVGWGQFNLAWTLTPMPGLPRTAGYTFGHAHNIALQWAIELGLPLTIGVSGLLAYALLRSAIGLWRSPRAKATVQRSAWVMVAIVLLHSQFEFPLWHAHFLLPTAFLLGLALPVGPRQPVESPAARGSAVAPLLVSLATAWALLDYRAIAAVYIPPADAPPLAERIARARGSLLFGHFADRLVATTASAGQRRLGDFQGIVFELLDWRLLASWAQAYAASGDVDRARFLAARLREFDSAGAKLLFAHCDTQPEAFQCQPPLRRYGFESFRQAPTTTADR